MAVHECMPGGEPSGDVMADWFSCLMSGIQYMRRARLRLQDMRPTHGLIKSTVAIHAGFESPLSITDGVLIAPENAPFTVQYAAPEASRSDPERAADVLVLGRAFIEMRSMPMHHLPKGLWSLLLEERCRATSLQCYDPKWTIEWIRKLLLGADRSLMTDYLSMILDNYKETIKSASEVRPAAADLTARASP